VNGKGFSVNIRTMLQLKSYSDRLRKIADILQHVKPGDPLIVSVAFDTKDYSDAFSICCDADPVDAHITLAILSQSITQISHTFCELKDEGLMETNTCKTKKKLRSNIDLKTSEPPKDPTHVSGACGRTKPR
jgi:hypothetical protein